MAKFTPEQIEALRLAKALGLRYIRLSGRHIYITVSDMEDDFDSEVAPRMIPALACLDNLEISTGACLDLTTFEFPPQKPEKPYLTVSVSIMDTEVMREILEVCARMSEDLNVPLAYRDEISDIRLRYSNWKEAEYE